jgi:predicted nucleotidyltransferase
LLKSQFLNKENVRNGISSELDQINDQARNYIQDVLFLIDKKLGIENVLSIILFGSQLPNNHKKKDCSPLSDCDLLIILKDNVSTDSMQKIEKYIVALENKHKFRHSDSNFVYKMLDVVEQNTGMFVSHFLTKKAHFENGVFHKIFSVNKMISDLFAPKKLVLSSVFDNSTVLWGEDLRNLIIEKIEISPFDMLKSLIMNLIISIVSIPLAPLKIFNIKYQLEAIKWSLNASNFYAFEDSYSLNKVIHRFLSIEKSKKYQMKAKRFYHNFLRLRQDPHNDINFMLRCPFRIIKIHIKGMLFKKHIIKKKKTLK